MWLSTLKGMEVILPLSVVFLAPNVKNADTRRDTPKRGKYNQSSTQASPLILLERSNLRARSCQDDRSHCTRRGSSTEYGVRRSFSAQSFPCHAMHFSVDYKGSPEIYLQSLM